MPSPPASSAEQFPIIRFGGVHKWFGTLHILKGITIKIPRGEVVVLCGPSGSGKSTLLRTVNRLEPIRKGELFVDGFPVHDPAGQAFPDAPPGTPRTLRELRAEIGVVFQQFNLYPHLRVLDNVTLAPRKVRKVPREEAGAQALSLLDRVGLRDKAAAYPAELSGGQQQRVAIARALAMRPKILLFDEPTSALDPEMTGEVLAVMKELARERYTILCVTHEMGFAREAADRILFMDQGEILEDARPADFFEAPRTERARGFLSQILSHTRARRG